MTGNIVSSRYELLEAIGESPLFIAHRAKELATGKNVVLKSLRPVASSSPAVVAALRSVVGSLSALRAPNICQMLGIEEHNGDLFLIEQYSRGLDLRARIQRTAPFTVAIAVDIALGIAEGIAAAHSSGASHGDLRPENVIVGPDWQVSVTGFGLLSVYDADPTLKSVRTALAIHYTSPEQIAGESPSPSCDIYAVGAMLYEMVVGAAPFRGERPPDIARSIMQDPPPSARASNAAVPKSVDIIIQRCLQKEASDRYASAQQLISDLREVKEALRFGKPLNWTPFDQPAATAVVSQQAREIDDEDEEEDSLPAWMRFMLKAMGAAALLAVLVLIGFVLSLYVAPDELPAPKLVGLSVEEGRRSAADSGFTIEVERQDYNPKAVPGTIYFSSAPEGRQLKKGSTIKVWVSLGERTVDLPDVTNLPASEARRELEKAGLVVSDRVQERPSEAIEWGKVMATLPPPGSKVSRDQPITLIVSRGADTTPFDDVQEETTNEPSALNPRSFVTNVRIPPGEHRVRIEVEDQMSVRDVVDETRDGGETVSFDVVGYGSRVKIRVYIDEELIREIAK